MTEPDPMRELHKIREKNYHETKHMSANEYIQHIKQKAKEFEAFRKTVKPVKDLETFFKELDDKKKAS
ncbi:MAG: hypothetical protein A3I68_03885 [Candidatus Melainabacteria bacterium RIFCSPLOWO2_02_FULL_35_15]|nr:MAG: hypothetical protein A3F80_01860 [Candidatus Melainabacteria bacterium RIFCSPLOWO2_12_FULL_35_11]OGI13314.1 MAG: hypothetical protein A3I68_03885 [Candidatus Melainabacteria bacterium RIFCSPLOWO2_02_FULL_35_15]